MTNDDTKQKSEDEKILSEITQIIKQDFGGNCLVFRNFLRRMSRSMSGFRNVITCTQAVIRELFIRQEVVLKLFQESFPQKMPEMNEIEKRSTILSLLGMNDIFKNGLGLEIRGNGNDREAAKIDCAGRMKICKAACCTLRFSLNKKEIDALKNGWSEDFPFRIKRTTNGYCIFFDQNMMQCSIYEKRPNVCRYFTCSKRKDIWADYSNMIPSKALSNKLNYFSKKGHSNKID